ncbi:MAG TPA: CBS domain-containing protein [Methylomirabilota bacterium]|nr:CBS domain-containing protein [Methylomirabilota bacterium]
MTVGSVMSRNVVTIESGQEVKDAAQLMLEHKAG